MLLHEILDRNVRCYPDREAVVEGSCRFTYRDLGERANRVTNALIDLGVKKGDRVALLAMNTYDYLANYFGIVQRGAVAVPINFRLTRDEVAYLLEHSDAKILIFGQAFLETVQSLMAGMKKVEHAIMMGNLPAPEGMLCYEDILSGSGGERPNFDVCETDVAVQMYTSGTTGDPKGAMLTHRNLVTVSFMGFAALQFTAEARCLTVAPLFHIGAVVIAFSTMLPGGTNIIMDQFQPEGVLKRMEEEKVTHGFFVPAMLQFLLAVPGVEEVDFSSLHTLCFGGAPISLELLNDCRNTFNCDLLQGFGQTEASTFVTVMSQEEYRKIRDHPRNAHRLESVGKDFPGVHVRIVDEEDRDVAQGEIGEIIARGDNVMNGYYKMAKETEETLKGGWLHTGDMGRFDEEGYLYLVDRKKDMIISGGENIYSREVEKVISKHSAVTEVAVVGVPDKKWGEVPRAFVVCVPEADVTEEGLIEHCRQSLAGFKCPKAVVFLDVLPRNASGKVLKKNLREGV
jgi:acyl-CoA synthetase (AMP-forming)/AMP-acid ligase II